MKEIWKDCIGFEGAYQVSNIGRVRSLDRIVDYNDGRRKPVKGRIIRHWLGRDGRPRVSLSSNNVKTGSLVNRLVAFAFLPPEPFPGAFVRHLDDVPTNNVVSNLAWGTQKDNMDDMRRNGNGNRGERNGSVKLTEGQVLAIAADTREQRIIAAEYGVSQCQISCIKSGLRWGWLTGIKCSKATSEVGPGQFLQSVQLGSHQASHASAY